MLILGSENMTCRGKLKESGLFRLNERKDTMFVSSYIKYCQKVEKANPFCIPVMDRMRSHRIKLQEGSFRLDISKCNLTWFHNSPLTCPSQILSLNVC